MGVFSKYLRYREAGEQANVNNVEEYGEPVKSLFTTAKVFTLHKHIDITDEQEQIVYTADTKFPSLHDKTDIRDAAGNQVAHMERKILTLDSIQSVTGKAIENGATYLSIMENNLNILELALEVK